MNDDWHKEAKIVIKWETIQKETVAEKGREERIGMRVDSISQT